YLDLSGIDFQFNPIPHSLSQLINLQHLKLSAANLSRSIPAQLANLSNLPNLDLSSNSLTGPIPTLRKPIRRCNPASWGLVSQCGFNLKDILHILIFPIMEYHIAFLDLPSRLRFLNLSSNEIKGTLPDITSVFALYPGMDLSNNQLEGPIPILPSKLSALNLSGNRFSRTLSFLCQINATLTFLDLSNNLLSRGMPDCLKKFQEMIVVLNLSNNSLSGEIPSYLGFFSRLQALYLRRNSFVGEIPMSLSNCTKLRFVDLGENKFSDNILAWIGETLSDLYVLVLRYSMVDYHPKYFLDLSNNAILGNIPRCFGNFTAMANEVFQADIMRHSYSSYIVTLPRSKTQHSYLSYGPLLSCYIPPYFGCGSNEEALFIDNA
ncbi:LOW QUALITY PROTEIN: hypothetical protein M8C21_021298, partial [Ambrosia artemisiifolia]